MKTNQSDTAVKKFLDGYNCAQAVLYAFCEHLEVDKDMALKLACGFGAGMGRKQELCGAVSGGIMVIGAKYGRGEKQGRSAMEVTYTKTRYLLEKFSERHGSYICRQLIDGCDLTTKEGQKYFKEKDLLKKTCTPCVLSVVDILKDIM